METTQIVSKNRFTRYFRESYEELKKVTWPTREQTTKSTYAVIGVSIAVATFIGILDFIFSKILEVAI